MRLRIVAAAFAALLCLSLSTLGEAHAQPRDDGGWFSLVTTAGKCVDVHGEDVGRDGARVHLWGCHGGTNQLWRYDNGMLVSATGKCLEIHGDEVGRDPARVQLWGCHGGRNQIWRVDESGVYRNDAGGCLDAEGGAVAVDGTRLIGWSCHGEYNQRFAVRGVPSSPRPRRWRQPSALDDRAFAALIERIERAPFSSDKLAQIELTARATLFRATQARALLECLPFSQDKLRALALIRRVSDPENAGLILEGFPFSSDRERASRILRER